MKFSNERYDNEELTYNDVFLFQQYFDGTSRMKDVTIHPKSKLSTTLPLISANMNAVTGKRMAETMARYWWLWVLPQDMSVETVTRIVHAIRWSHQTYQTPIVVHKENTIRDALWLMYKRSHLCVVMVDDKNKVLDLFTEKDFSELDQYTPLWSIKKPPCVTVKEWISSEEAFMVMQEKRISVVPVINDKNILVWVLTKKHCIRTDFYNPTLNTSWQLDVAVAIGLNWFEEKAQKFYDLWLRVFVMDTAHGFQKRMIEAVQKCRSMFWDDLIIIAWNVITKEWTKALIQAWADWVKVWVWPWAMCTTRMKTWVWRPQFSAVRECSLEARKLGWFVWADWWIKNPRDLALALAAWATHVMMWSILAWTYESTGDVKHDADGAMYKENYWMASTKAVILRNKEISSFEQAKRKMFREGISTSKIYMKKDQSSTGDIVDNFITGLRSSMTYVWARTSEEFYEKAIVWVQTWAGYNEGTPHGKVLNK